MPPLAPLNSSSAPSASEKTTSSGVDDFNIHAMPETYRHSTQVALRSQPAKPLPEPIVVPQPVIAKPPPAPAKSATSLPASTVKKPLAPVARRGRIIFGGLATIALLALSIGAVILTTPKKISETVPASNSAVPITPPPIVIPPPEPIVITSPPELVATDSDSDGLTDREEKNIYGTDAQNPDSDADSYLDGGEVFNLYNPAGIAPERLAETPSVRYFLRAEDGYSVLVPSQYIPQTDNGAVVWTSTEGDEFIFSAESNFGNLSLDSWLIAKGVDTVATGWQPFRAKNGMIGGQSADRLITYLMGDGVVFGIRYRPANGAPPMLRQTYAMMLNSFREEPRLMPTSVPSPAEPAIEIPLASPESATTSNDVEVSPDEGAESSAGEVVTEPTTEIELTPEEQTIINH